MKCQADEVKSYLKKFYQIALQKETKTVPSVFLQGPAGIGKSQIVQQIAEELSIPFVCIALSNSMDPESIAGFPVQGEGETFRMNLRPSIYELASSEKPGILFIDEVGRESSEVRAVLLKLISEKVLNEVPINSLIVLAGNIADENYSVKEFDLALNSRLYKLELVPTVENVASYFFSKIRKIEKAKNISFQEDHPYRRIAKFLLDNPKYLTGIRNEIYLCPRTWEYVAIAMENGLPLSPLIGSDLSIKLKAYFKIKNISFMDYLKGTVRMRNINERSLLKISFELEDYIFTNYKGVIKFLNERALPLRLAVVPLRKLIRNDEVLTKFPNFLTQINGVVKALWEE